MFAWLRDFISNKLWPIHSKKDICEECNEVYYICTECGCQFDMEEKARLCADWDIILGSGNHSHMYPHDHEEQ